MIAIRRREKKREKETIRSRLRKGEKRGERSTVAHPTRAKRRGEGGKKTIFGLRGRKRSISTSSVSDKEEGK